MNLELKVILYADSYFKIKYKQFRLFLLVSNVLYKNFEKNIILVFLGGVLIISNKKIKKVKNEKL